MARRVHTPALLQMEAAECGAAALGIILAHHGKIVPLAELRRECGVSRDGSNAKNLLAAARRHGLEAKGYSATIEDLRGIDPPCILFWGFNHFLVLEGIRGDRVFLNDPAVGHRRVDLTELEELFTGVALTLTPGPDFEPGGQAPRLSTALASRLAGFRPALSFAVLAGILLVIPGLLIPALTQVFVDEILIADRKDWLWPLVIALFLAVGAQGSLKWLQLSCLRRLRIGLAAKMSARYFRHLLRLPVSFYEQRYAGEIGNRSRLNDKVADVLSGQLAQTLIDVVMMVFYAGLMFFYDVSLTLIGVTSAIINFAVLSGLARRRVGANMRLLQEYGKVDGVSIAGLQSMETIKASGMESGFFQRWAGLHANASNARRDLSMTNAVLGIVPGLLAWITTLLVLVVGGGYVIEGRLTVGMLVAFEILMWSFLRPIGTLVGLGRVAQELQGDMARLDDVLAHPADAESGSAGRLAPDPAPDLSREKLRLDGHLELRNVTFGYSPTAPPLLENFSLTLEPGRRVALVGGSGSGKTTVAKLICGLYEPWSGEVLFDGVRRQEVPSWLMSHSLSMVDQEVMMFSGTVRENLTLWDESVPENSLVRSCRDAEVLDVVRSLPGGMDGELGEGGGNLSGGERQRLEIARSLTNNPSILVLDEATSALDAESERAIVERIGLRGCSCLCVAHRLSTIRDCDEILVLEKGQVVERGTHEELWRLDGIYRDLLHAADGTEGPVS